MKIKKLQLFITIFIAALIAAGFSSVIAAEKETPRDNSAVVMIGGGDKPGVSFSAVLIEDTAYVPVREFSVIMGASAVFRAGDTATVKAPGLELTATAGDGYIIANGWYLYAPTGCRIIDSEVFAPLRPIAEAFGASVTWSNAFRAVFITRGEKPIEKAAFSQEDVYWLSRIIYAEAGNESLTGKIAVGNVVMNRVKSSQFPDTVYGVIFDRRYNTVQFTPASSGAIYNNPNKDCVAAAHLAMSGVNTAGDSLYFASTSKCWAARNREVYGGIGNHIFYL